MTQRIDFQKTAPEAAKAMYAVRNAVMASGLPARLLDLVFLRTSQINGCAYCIDMHSADLLKQGLPLPTLLLLAAWREAGDLFDPREQAALAWAETVTRVAETGVPDEAYEAARAAFGEKELVELTVAIGLMNAYNRIGVSLRLTPGAVTARREAA